MPSIWRPQPVQAPYQPQPLRRPQGLTSPLATGTASFVGSGPAGISVTATDASGGYRAYSYQWQRNTDGGSYSNLSGATSLSITDATGTTGHLYGYQLVYTDNVSTTVTSNAVTASVYTGGAISSGVGSKSGQRRRER